MILIYKEPRVYVCHVIPGKLFVVYLIDDIVVLQGSSVDEAART